MSRSPDDLIVKDPDADEPQGFDWTLYLAELGAAVEIASSSWLITGPDSALTFHGASTIDVGPLTVKTQAYLAGGTMNGRYRVTNRIVTNSSPAVTDDRSFWVLVQDR